MCYQYHFFFVVSEPWFIIGDLNEINGNHEKDGGSLRCATSFIPFNNMIRNSGLLEFPVRDNKWSWQGRRGKWKGAVMIRCRLDRALANEEWHTFFPCSYTEYLRMVGSDHHPVVAFLEDNLLRKKRDSSGLTRDGTDMRVLWNQLWQVGQKTRKDK